MSGFFESFSLMAIFLAIGGFGFLFLLISFIFGDIFEAVGLDFGTDFDGGDDFGVFDSRVISIFLTAFGGFGAIGTAVGYGAAGSLLFGLIGGFIFGAIVFYFGKLLYNQQSSSSVSNADLIGRTAQVIVGIKPDQLGQISCRIGDERVEKLARTASGEEIKAGQIVRIDSIGSDSVIVSIESDERISLFSEKA
jgi:membrane protein implicated in regulation of membrane protease activity